MSGGGLLEDYESNLRAFVKNTEITLGEGTYQAQYLTQDQVDETLGQKVAGGHSLNARKNSRQ